MFQFMKPSQREAFHSVFLVDRHVMALIYGSDGKKIKEESFESRKKEEKLETNGFKVLWEVNIPDDKDITVVIGPADERQNGVLFSRIIERPYCPYEEKKMWSKV
ncbi:hypothetical protein L596_020340 [Steinernema carpocapsae]|uniref:Uncharacterized protein n=1 Tax=Steinernema carpocapsae TaxID=34508 RepID=A0A4U5MTW6_STECR|nr:hypothetical protein L596_020340 [Steinernema carpocapsae]